MSLEIQYIIYIVSATDVVCLKSKK